MEMSKNRGLEMEPSEEFPILFGLLTERKKRDTSAFQQRPRRAILTANSSITISIVEPDSSTPDEVVAPEVNAGQRPPSATSPLLILRLTSNQPTINRCNRRLNHQLRTNQPRPTSRRRNPKLILNEEDCTPSSTTTEGEESPNKRQRTCRDDDMPLLEPMVTTTSSSNYSLVPTGSTPSPPKLTSSTLIEPGGTPCRSGEDSGTTNEKLPLASSETGDENSDTSSVFFNPEVGFYGCDYCDLKFKRQFHLLRHMATHEDKREVCCHCNTAFYRKDNLLVHQRNCQRSRSLRRSPAVEPIRRQRPPRPPPRTLADLLDRQDDYDGKYAADRYIQLPSGLEISEIPSDSNQLKTPPPSPVPGRNRMVETVSMAEQSDEEPQQDADDVVEIFPCGHCRQVFETFSRLLKHTAAKHIKNPTDGTFHFEIETVMDE